MNDLPICKRSSCPVTGRPSKTWGVKRRPGLKFWPEIPHTSLQLRPGWNSEAGLLLTLVSTVSVDLLEGFENEDQKLEKEKAEEPEMGDGCVG